MEHKITGRLKKSEFLEFHTWNNKKLFLIPLLLTIAIFVFIYGIMGNWPLYYFEIYAEYLIREGSRVFVIMSLIWYAIWLFVSWSKSLVGYTYALKDFIFDEEGLQVRFDNGGSNLPWTKVDKVTVSNVALTITFMKHAKIYLPNRYFADEAERAAIIAFVQAKVTEQKEARI